MVYSTYHFSSMNFFHFCMSLFFVKPAAVFQHSVSLFQGLCCKYCSLDTILLYFWNCSCNYDYLDIRDGGTENSPSIAKLCGSESQSTIRSTSNVMRIRLVTDASVGKGGFNITYQKGKYKFSQTKLWPSV